MRMTKKRREFLEGFLSQLESQGVLFSIFVGDGLMGLNPKQVLDAYEDKMEVIASLHKCSKEELTEWLNYKYDPNYDLQCRFVRDGSRCKNEMFTFFDNNPKEFSTFSRHKLCSVHLHQLGR